MTPVKKFGVIFLTGAVAGTAYDYVHVYFRVLAYVHPDFFGTQLAFVPALFGVSAVLAALVVRLLSRSVSPPSVTWGRAVLDGLLLLVAYLLTGIFVGSNGFTFIALLPIVALSVGSRPSKFVIIGSVAAAVVGPLGEICISSSGVFHYLHVELIPVWLPLLWIVAAGAFMDVSILAQVCFLQKKTHDYSN